MDLNYTHNRPNLNRTQLSPLHHPNLHHDPLDDPLKHDYYNTNNNNHIREFWSIEEGERQRDYSANWGIKEEKSSSWEEDFLSGSDTEFGDIGLDALNFDDKRAITPLPAATLTKRPYPRSIPLTDNEEAFPARQPRLHERSLSSLLPLSLSFRNPKQEERSRSPERREPKKLQKEKVVAAEKRNKDDFMATLTGDRDGVINVADKGRGLASWFSGSSAPVGLGPLMGGEDEELPSEPPKNLARPTTRPQLETFNSSATVLTSPTKIATGSGIFGYFSPKKSPTKQTIQLPTSLLENDDLLTLDISEALFPSGRKESDPFSPAAFKNLLQNAEGILSKLQSAYKVQSLSLHNLSAETAAQSEELTEAETRAQCLKTQLEDMARRVTQQDEAMEELTLQLAYEKQMRAEEKEAREKSIALVKAGREARQRADDVEDEDLGVDRRRWRDSDSISISESEKESVFSRSRSPTSTTSTEFDASSLMTLDSGTTPEILQASLGRVVSLPAHARGIERPSIETSRRPTKLQKQKSGYEKVIQMGGATVSRRDLELGGMGGCSNCEGKESRAAWDTVGVLRAENRGLKERVEGLECAVEGALDMLTHYR